MPSRAYELFEQAMRERKQIWCSYGGFSRKLCPVLLGHTNGRERALTFQFGGETSTELAPGGEWRCLDLARASDIELHDGPWRSGDSHKRPQGCVQDVDIDINPQSPYTPRRPR
jgi:hypothetical protein